MKILKTYDCKLCEHSINDYLEGKLTDADTVSFLEHVESCPSCFDELNIQYLIKVGLSSIDDIAEINFSEDIKVKKAEARKRVNSERNVKNVFAVLMCMAFLLFLGATLMIIL